MVKPRRFEVYLVALDPAVGAEMQKTRPCVVVSPDNANTRLRTVVIAPLTSQPKNFPNRVQFRFQGQNAEVGIDQLRAVDKTRLHKRLTTLGSDDSRRVCEALVEFFAF